MGCRPSTMDTVPSQSLRDTVVKPLGDMESLPSVTCLERGQLTAQEIFRQPPNSRVFSF
jgi:hypothetical protein